MLGEQALVIFITFNLYVNKKVFVRKSFVVKQLNVKIILFNIILILLFYHFHLRCAMFAPRVKFDGGGIIKPSKPCLHWGWGEESNILCLICQKFIQFVKTKGFKTFLVFFFNGLVR